MADGGPSTDEDTYSYNCTDNPCAYQEAFSWTATTPESTYGTFPDSAQTTSTDPDPIAFSTAFTFPDLDPCDIRNQSEYPDLTQLPWVGTLLTAVYLLIIVLSVCGNALVMVTVWKNSHMHTVTNYYIVNLAVSDLLVSVLVMPLKLLEYSGPCHWNVFGNRLLCPIISYIQPIFVFASVLTLVAISLERVDRRENPLLKPLSNKRSTVGWFNAWLRR